jgi:hypothetical protein
MTEDKAKQALSIPYAGGMLMPSNFPEALQMASLIAKSGMVPKSYDGNAGAVLVAIAMGAEIGLTPMASIQNVAVINGRPSLWGDAVLAVCTSHRECEDIIETYDDATKTAICTVRRRGRHPVVRQFSETDAKLAGLWGKAGPWTQYPKRMLQMRARGFALRDAFPDALRGIRMAEEERDVIDVTPMTAAPEALPVGVSKFGRAKAKAEAKAKAAEPVSIEPPHDPSTGEVTQDDEWAHVGPPPMAEEV